MVELWVACFPAPGRFPAHHDKEFLLLAWREAHSASSFTLVCRAALTKAATYPPTSEEDATLRHAPGYCSLRSPRNLVQERPRHIVPPERHLRRGRHRRVTALSTAQPHARAPDHANAAPSQGEAVTLRRHA
ncbi:MAG: hypothetical protein NVSMB65_06180 [Chloroflexota bacterium]